MYKQVKLLCKQGPIYIKMKGELNCFICDNDGKSSVKDDLPGKFCCVFKFRLLPRAIYGKHHAVQGISIPFLADGLEFLHDQFACGLSYSAINTARSALSIINLFPDAGSFGNHP